MKYLLTHAALAASGVSASLGARDEAASPLLKREVNGSYIPGTAPFVNIFAGITEEEQESVHEWLERQANVTLPGNVDFNPWDVMWLHAPNKTDALAYLDEDGTEPGRYARVLGRGDCFVREYMVGPLPIDDSTKATPLETVEVSCLDSEAQGEDSPMRRRDTGSRRSKEKRGIYRRYPTNPYDEEMTWNEEELPHDDQAPPVAILPDGARHEFDPEQNYVSWMDYTFYVATGPGGVSLHDVRFKGERVIYELAMQEALAHYAGPDQAQTYASYLDVTIGFTWFNLIPGFDCPAYATYSEAFCLFEFPKDYPMSRHNNYDYYHATKNTAFMVRSVSTVGNYDYMTTYEFHHDGSIQVSVRASGYIQGSSNVNATNMGEYGFRIRDDLSGSMHDHVLNFKADLDVLGTKNSLFKSEFVPHSQVYDWSDGQVINTMKVERSFISNEDEGRINWAPNAAAAYSVVNKDKPNDFGEYPGFRIYPSIGSTIHNTVQNSTVFPGRLNWATHHLYALQRKDSEPVSSHPSYPWSDDEILVDFDDFFDGESLDQEDLVLYFNLGMHHMPDTYDLPVTVFQGAQSGVTFRPQNYQRSDAALSTRQQVHITNKGGEAQVETYGLEELSGSYDLQDANPPYYPVPDFDTEE